MAKKDRDAVRQGMGDLLGPSSDLLSQVLEGDRRRTGRGGATAGPAPEISEDPARPADGGEGPAAPTSAGPSSKRGRTESSSVADTTGNVVGSTTNEPITAATDHAKGPRTDRPKPKASAGRSPATAETVEPTDAAPRSHPATRGSGGEGEPDRDTGRVANRGTAAPRPEAPAAEPAPAWSPLEAALREMLGKPYATDLTKGPFTVTSMKLHTEISERLGWAASLTKRPKQDIVSEALRLYFERLLREG